MTDIKKLGQDLISLCRLDIDAAIAYEQAIPHIDHPVVKKRFQEFLEDHNRHIAKLSLQLRDLHVTPPAREPDFKGFFIKGFTDLRSSSGTEGALAAMDANEKLINRAYNDALSWPALVPNALDLVKTNCQDENKHLEFIEEAIEARVWERTNAVK
jgi:hypothetical protein